MGALRAAFGAERVVQAPDPIMSSEDFAFVLQEVPGTFVMLACSPPDLDAEAAPAWNHSPRVLFDDSVLGDQAAALAHLAMTKVGVRSGAQEADPDRAGSRLART